MRSRSRTWPTCRRAGARISTPTASTTLRSVRACAEPGFDRSGRVVRRLSVVFCPFAPGRSNRAHSAFERAQRARAVAESVELESHAIEQRYVEIGQRSFIWQAQVAAGFDRVVGLAHQQDRQVVVRVGIAVTD